MARSVGRDQVRAAEPEFVLLRQAYREVATECCDAGAAEEYLARLPWLAVRCRFLARVSPFAQNWTQPGPEAAEAGGAADDALQDFYQVLMARKRA